MTLAPVTYLPIGIYFQSAHQQKADVPRQGVLVREAGRIELDARTGLEHAIRDLERWERVWILFHFHQAGGFRPTVWPPRSEEKRGVLSTRSPHRPNPIGLSAARLLSVDAGILHVTGADLLDGTPVLDVKPYVAYADAFPDAGQGWLAPSDPLPAWHVRFTAAAEAELAWLEARGVSLREPLERALSLGPTPQPYRRIKRRGEAFELSLKEWRATFVQAAPLALEVTALRSGYKAAQRESDPALVVHRDFAASFQVAGVR